MSADITLYNQVQQEWGKISVERKSAETLAGPAVIELHKKLLKLFHIGDFYYYLFNIRAKQFEFISAEIVPMLGYPMEQVMDVCFFLSLIHPEDQPWYLKIETELVRFFNPMPHTEAQRYKVRYDFRVRRADGCYIRLLQQMLAIEADEDGVWTKTMGSHTDITFLKKEGRPTLSFIGIDDAPLYIDVLAGQTPLLQAKEVLTTREKQVLQLMVQGKLSKEIADQLCIDKTTVDSHRKKMLRKTGAATSGELLSIAFKNSWI